MKFLKTCRMLFMACLLAGCAATATEAPFTSTPPPVPTSTAMPAATATSAPTPSTPVITKTIPTPIDPGLGVIQINYSNSSGPSNASLSLVDPETGLTLQDKASFPGHLDAIVAKPGWLAAVQGTNQVCEPMAYGTACYDEADVLHLVELASSREITATLPAQGWVDLAAFSPDGTRLALADNQKQSSTIMLFDAGDGSLLASQTLSIRPSLIAFRQSENQLVVYGQSPGSNPGVQKPPDPHVLLLDLPDLNIAWDRQLSGVLSGYWCETNCDGSFGQRSFASWFPAVVVTPDASALYIAHANQDSLTSVDLQARTVKVTGLQTAHSWLDQLLSWSTQVAFAKGNQNGTNMQAVLSPNGQRLYLLAQSFHSTQGADGNWKTDVSYSGLQVIDVKTARILNHLETHATQIQISPDGDYLYLMNWDSPQAETQIVSTENLQIVKSLIGWEVTLTRRLNGTPIALVSQVDYSNNEEVGVLNLQSFSIDHSWKTSSVIQFLSIFPNYPLFVP